MFKNVILIAFLILSGSIFAEDEKYASSDIDELENSISKSLDESRDLRKLVEAEKLNRKIANLSAEDQVIKEELDELIDSLE